MSDSPRSRRRPVVLLSFVLVGVIGVAAALLALADTEDDPINVLLQNWPLVALAGLIYALGMCVYAVSWALLFDKADNRGLIGLSFLISQPVKYLPGGVAQPISQVALTAQVSESRAGAVVAFPVHVLINVIVGLTLAAPLLLVMEQASWARWLIVLVPLLWVPLDRRWMVRVLDLLGRLHRIFRVGDVLPAQRAILQAAGAGLVAHALMFLVFGLMAGEAITEFSVLGLSVAYGLAWVVGYVALPAPAGLGAREATLVALVGTGSTMTVIQVSAAHRILTLLVELILLALASLSLRRAIRGRQPDTHGLSEPVPADEAEHETPSIDPA